MTHYHADSALSVSLKKWVFFFFFETCSRVLCFFFVYQNVPWPTVDVDLSCNEFWMSCDRLVNIKLSVCLFFGL